MDKEKMTKERDNLSKELMVCKEEKEKESLRLFQRIKEIETKYSQIQLDKENMMNKIDKINIE